MDRTKMEVLVEATTPRMPAGGGHRQAKARDMMLILK
ncbi:hypothetical protein J2Z66_001841 [Paenibacillus eucommiae]|uniref:Uncharacterized protein n=1 Tax=Paenibacillus eucommiae TaxID=1355755 RepID=A0ABS4IRP1_9BACL|nr:hypothetical protein [Paenibacillus eucommiae]